VNTFFDARFSFYFETWRYLYGLVIVIISMSIMMLLWLLPSREKYIFIIFIRNIYMDIYIYIYIENTSITTIYHSCTLMLGWLLLRCNLWIFHNISKNWKPYLFLNDMKKNIGKQIIWSFLGHIIDISKQLIHQIY